MAGVAGSFTNDEYTDIVLCYGETRCNAVAARSLYQRRFPMRRVPSLNVFRRTVTRLRVEGSFTTQPARDRPVTENEEDVHNVVQYFEQHPTRGMNCKLFYCYCCYLLSVL